MQSEYVTVAEFARRNGVSVQAVYKRLKTTLKPFSTTVDGIQQIDIAAYIEAQEPDSPPEEDSTVNNDSTDNDSTVDNGSTVELNRLQHDLEVAQRQIDDLRADKLFLQGQLSEVTKSLQFEQRKVDELQKLLNAPQRATDGRQTKDQAEDAVIETPEESPAGGENQPVQGTSDGEDLSFWEYVRRILLGY